MKATLLLVPVAALSLLGLCQAEDCIWDKQISIWKSETFECNAPYKVNDIYVKIVDKSTIGDSMELKVTHPCGSVTKDNGGSGDIAYETTCTTQGPATIKITNQNWVMTANAYIRFSVTEYKGPFLADKNPVIAVPGVAGSMLRYEDNSLRKDELIWARMIGLENTLMEVALGRFNKKSGRYEGFNDDRYHIYPPLDHGGTYAIDNLNPDVPLDLPTYWHGFFNFLGGLGYKAGVSLWGFPYDWRQSNRYMPHMERMKELVEKAYKKAGNKKVTFITHSMGCLQVRSFIATFPHFAQKHVGKWIALGCPWQGGTGITTKAVIGGYDFGMTDFLLPSKKAHQVQVGCPSLYEMLPNPKFDYSPAPSITLTINGKTTHFGIGQYNEIFEGVNKNNVEKHGGQEYHLTWDQDLWEHTLETHKLWDNLKLPDRLNLFNVYGTGLDTPHSATYTKDIKEYSELLFESPQTTWITKNPDLVNGDGTVCFQCARNSQLVETQAVMIDAEHFAMITDQRTFEKVQAFLEADIQSNNVLKAQQGSHTVDLTYKNHIRLATILGIAGIAGFTVLVSLLVAYRRRLRNINIPDVGPTPYSALDSRGV